MACDLVRRNLEPCQNKANSPSVGIEPARTCVENPNGGHKLKEQLNRSPMLRQRSKRRSLIYGRRNLESGRVSGPVFVRRATVGRTAGSGDPRRTFRDGAVERAEKRFPHLQQPRSGFWQGHPIRFRLETGGQDDSEVGGPMPKIHWLKKREVDPDSLLEPVF
jgi:hypothetical protein